MKKEKKKRHPALIIFLVIILIFAALLYDSNYRIVTQEYEVASEDIPVGFDGFRIVQLSDVHAAEFGKNNETLIEKVREAAPDIIVITGDLIDADDQAEIVRTLVTALVEISPVYYVTGNHEWDCGVLPELFEILEQCGAVALRNEYTVLERGGDSIVLAGVDDPNGRADMKTPEELYAEIAAEQGDIYTVLLAHRNNRLPQYAGIGYDFVLSGHAHGGIVRLPFTDGLVGPTMEWFPTNTSGLYYDGDSVMLVSRGIGNHTGVPRFLNNPHLPVAVLKSV